MQTNIGTHCKVSFNDQYRRFFFTGTEFTSLYQQVKNLLTLDGEFVLKYKDNEGDMITMSTDLELGCALSYSYAGLLRLKVDLLERTEKLVERTEQPHSPEKSDDDQFKCKRGSWKHGIHGESHHHDWKANRWAGKKEKMIQKRDLFNSLLSSFPTERELTAEEAVRKSLLQAKVSRIDSCLEKWDKRCTEGRNGGCPKNWGKCGKRWEGKKGEKSTLSPQAVEEITALKEQMKTIRPKLMEIKSQIRAKKQELHATNDMTRVEVLKTEICGLKQEIFHLRGQLCPLKLRIRSIKMTAHSL
jgi:hypothetical protein